MPIWILLGPSISNHSTAQQAQVCSALAACHVIAAALLANAYGTLGSCEHAGLSQHLFKLPSSGIHCQGAVMLNMQIKTHSSLAFQARNLQAKTTGLALLETDRLLSMLT